MVPASAKPRRLSGKRRLTAAEQRLAQAVRNSLNLPRLGVHVRQNKRRGRWSFLLQEGRARSEWVELDAAAVAVMKKVGLLPPLHLGTFRLAYAALREGGQSRKRS